MPFPILLTALSFVAACVIADLRDRRIPNLLSLPTLALGMIINLVYFGVSGLCDSIGGLAIATLVLLGPFATGGIGAGDVKMMAAVGALLGARLGFISLVAGLAIGGLVMMVHLARIGRLAEKLRATWTMALSAYLTHSLQPLVRSPEDSATVALPYSVPLAVGTMIAGVVAYLSGGGA